MNEAPNHGLLTDSQKALSQKVNEGFYDSAREWAFIMEWQLRLLRNVSPRENDELTEERIELVEKLSWALYDAAINHGYRVADDLHGVERLAKTVQADGPVQPEWLEVGSTMYDCGECGHSFLDRVYIHPDTPHQGEWLACVNCGWTDHPDDADVWDNEWYSQRYSG